MSFTNDHLSWDWFQRPLPANIRLGENVYIESSYAFAAFHSQMPQALVMGDGAGAYDLSSLATGPCGRIRVGAYTCLNSSNLIAEESIAIGAHCLFAWGTVVTDSTMPKPGSASLRRIVMREIGSDPMRRLRPLSRISPVRIEDNVWVGFDSVITGGVTIGRGAIVGCKTVVAEDVPPYAVMVGNPCRLVRVLEPDDDEESRQAALREFGLPSLARTAG
jgi:acetyltransferase-like isoleucine patch superfamily enzyme